MEFAHAELVEPQHQPGQVELVFVLDLYAQRSAPFDGALDEKIAERGGERFDLGIRGLGDVYKRQG